MFFILRHGIDAGWVSPWSFKGASEALQIDGFLQGVPCPGTGCEALLTLELAKPRVLVHGIDARVLRAASDARLRGCSNWPERQNCNQACLRYVSRAAATG
jgi:hypothetical protein